VTGARPLLCINGGLIYGHELLWPALSPLAGRRQLVFYDQRGRGESEPPSDPKAARIEHDAADAAALRVALGYTRWDVLGHSWGGGIAMLAAEEDRGGIDRLILVDAVGPTSAWLADLHDSALKRVGAAHSAVLRRLDTAALREPSPEVHSAYSRAMYPAWFFDGELAQAFAPRRRLSETGSAVAAQLQRDGYDWTRRVRAIQARTLVLQGERDLVSPAVAHELCALILKARLELIPQCGHMPFWEAPETFFKTVDSFLTAP
jgi:proline iminopeptidase